MTMMDDVWVPEPLPETEEKLRSRKYAVTCRCGNTMRVRMKHFGRMCRCTQCRFPIYVTYDNVDPPVGPGDRQVPRVFKAHEIPVHWQKGDLLMDIYEVRETLGQGGMGVVYRVYHRGWGKNLAVKTPSAKLLGDEDWIVQFEHECETWINLPPYPNVVECHYVRRVAGVPRVFVEYVKGLDLGQFIDNKTLYAGSTESALERMLDIAIQFCWGLHHAHIHGVIHQDVKPGNVIIGEDNIAKVTDFGLARVLVGGDGSDGSSGSGSSGSDRESGPDRLSEADKQKLKGLSGGTPTYRSGDHKRYGQITSKVDMWSWGVSMIEMFSGDVYWSHGSDALKVLDNLITHGSRYEAIPVMPEKLQLLLKQCFESDPENRPRDMLAVARILQTIYEEDTGQKYQRSQPERSDATIDVLNNRAVSLLDLGKHKEAEALWRDVLKQQAEHIEAIYNRALHHWKTGHITDAQMVEKMYALCEAHEGEWLPAYLLGRVLIERGDAAVAIPLLENIPQDERNKREVAYGQAQAQNFVQRDKKLVWEFKPDDSMISAVSLSFDGWHALTGSSEGEIRVWEIASRNCTAKLSGHTDRVHSLCLSDEERMALSASADKTLRVWDPTSGKCLQTLQGHQGPVRTGVLSGNAKHAISCSEDGTIMLWDTATGKQLRIFMGHQGSVNSVAITRCGNFVLSASSDCTIKQWDLWSGKCLRTFEGNDSRVNSVCVSGDGELMLVACDRYLQLWNLDTGVLENKIRGHSNEIFTVCLNESGRYALSATGMGTIKVWDVMTGQCLRSFQGHAQAALSRDGHYAISCGKVGDFKVWAVSIDESPFPAQYVLSK